MTRFILTVLFFSSVTSLAQTFDESHIKAEQERYLRSLKLSEVQYPGDQTIDATYYKLDLTISYSPQNLKGIATISAKPDPNPVTNFFLDLQNTLTVDSVVLGNNQLAFTHSAAKLNITLPRSYNSGEEFSVKVYYHGVPGSSGFGSFEFGNHNGQPAIWSLSEPYGASDWWPCKDTPADKVDSSDVWVTCDTYFKVASNGKLEGITVNGDGTHTYKWKNSYPIAHYLISIAMANYTEYLTYFNYSPVDSMPITHFIYPESFADNKSQLDKTAQMIQIFSDTFGLYPFINEKYGHAQFGWGGGMEHQTITSLGGFSDGLIAHELAHQWFGDKVTCKDWHHIWINEGFATYCEGVYYEATGGKAAYNNFIQDEMNSAKSANGTIWVQDITSVWEIFNGPRSYAKGCVVLHMLRGIVGDSVFYNIMRSFLDHPDYAFGVANTEDFQSVAENISGLDLDYFFQQWIYGEKYPRYTVNWGKNLVSGDIYNVNLVVNQTTNTTNPTYFTMPVQIEVTTNYGDTLITLFNNLKNQTFNFEVRGYPTALSFDPNNFILKNLNITTGVEDQSLFFSYKLDQNYPNPFNSSTKIKFTISTPSLSSPLSNGRNEARFVTLKVYDILGREVTTLVNEEKPAGEYEVEFNSSSGIGDLVSGIYFYQLQAGDPLTGSGQVYLETKKMILMK
jgi:aminopeptidase N